jgi:hypothetical protein
MEILKVQCMSEKRKKNKPDKSANPMWGGQFTCAPAELLAKINASVSFDKQL